AQGAGAACAARSQDRAAARQCRHAARQAGGRRRRCNHPCDRRIEAARSRRQDHRTLVAGRDVAGAGARHLGSLDPRRRCARAQPAGAARSRRNRRLRRRRTRVSGGARRLVPYADRRARDDRQRPPDARCRHRQPRRKQTPSYGAQGNDSRRRGARTRRRRRTQGPRRTRFLRMKALVTRPREDAAGLVAALTARGIEPLLEPLLTIALTPDASATLAAALPGAQAVLFTSANGVRAFASVSPQCDLPAFAVGDATARAARAAGFGRIESAGGDVHALAALAARRLDPAAGPLIHAAASAVAGDLAGDLTRARFTVRRLRLYEAVAATRLSAESCSAIIAGAVACAIFFSPRTAETFVTLACAAGIGSHAAT